MKILIIEDEKDLREVMTRSLEKERFVVETAADYSTALQKINDYDYDCILLDIMLPGGSGLSILEELKKLKKRESVIIVSAKDSIEDKVTGLDLGADDYLAKPFHLAELHARVKSVIPVSYTQLDVYKRQVPINPTKFVRLSFNCPLAASVNNHSLYFV